ncbi:carboxypeptidase-like regulatory domain-containing protein [Hymenobacter sp. BT178]|uniref:Carboxypeptidase-like regulatory domain-containing protein n=1 Tax=Hymenobacter lucidus TaxID=2880930 RepID=A0ABS8AMG0_9BACT|nr:carboxypeptidase-like regulatory domain-containing protein [Hymenobacter lucidus]
MLLLILLLALSAGAQQAPVRVSGSVSDQATRQSIPGATVWNVSQRRGAVANAEGEFNVSVGASDTLEFRTVGYETQRLTVGSPGLAQLVVQIRLRRATILLTGVTVREAGRPTDAVISRALRNMKRPVPPVVSQVKRPALPQPLFAVDSLAPRMPVATLQNPVSFLYDQFSRAGMQRRKMAEILVQKQREAAQQQQRSYNKYFIDNRGYEVETDVPALPVKATYKPLAPAHPVQPPAGSLLPST